MWFAWRQMLDCIIMFSAQDQYCPYGVLQFPSGSKTTPSGARQIIPEMGQNKSFGIQNISFGRQNKSFGIQSSAESYSSINYRELLLFTLIVTIIH